ncbi:MAG: hypothetical protein ABIQ99_08125 [Thermoflexales bacterium]
MTLKRIVLSAIAIGAIFALLAMGRQAEPVSAGLAGITPTPTNTPIPQGATATPTSTPRPTQPAATSPPPTNTPAAPTATPTASATPTRVLVLPATGGAGSDSSTLASLAGALVLLLVASRLMLRASARSNTDTQGGA